MKLLMILIIEIEIHSVQDHLELSNIVLEVVNKDNIIILNKIVKIIEISIKKMVTFKKLKLIPINKIVINFNIIQKKKEKKVENYLIKLLKLLFKKKIELINPH